jgi:hypothetical protein
MSIIPKPLKIATVFNTLDFTQPTQNIVNTGNQSIAGILTTTGDIVNGDENVSGYSYNGYEPFITNVTPAINLLSNQLTTKSYVDAKASSNPYPMLFSFGTSYDNTNTVQMEDGYVKIKSHDSSKYVHSCIVEIAYQYTECYSNSFDVDSQTSWTGIFLISYGRTVPFNTVINGTTITTPSALFNPKFKLLSGNNLTTIKIRDTPNVYPISIGLKDNCLAINYNFPTWRNENNTQNSIVPGYTWISSYGVSMRLLYSTPNDSTSNLQLLAPSNDGINSFTGSMYFSTN